MEVKVPENKMPKIIGFVVSLPDAERAVILYGSYESNDIYLGPDGADSVDRRDYEPDYFLYSGDKIEITL